MNSRIEHEFHFLDDKDKAEILMTFADCCFDLIQDLADEYGLHFDTVLHIIDAKVNLSTIKPVPLSNTFPIEDS